MNIETPAHDDTSAFTRILSLASVKSGPDARARRAQSKRVEVTTDHLVEFSFLQLSKLENLTSLRLLISYAERTISILSCNLQSIVMTFLLLEYLTLLNLDQVLHLFKRLLLDHLGLRLLLLREVQEIERLQLQILSVSQPKVFLQLLLYERAFNLHVFRLPHH